MKSRKWRVFLVATVLLACVGTVSGATVDDFEDNDISEYSGPTSNWGTTNSDSFGGTYSLTKSGNDGNHGNIYFSNDKKGGEPLNISVYWKDKSGAQRGGVGFLNNDNSGAGYFAQVDEGNGLRIFEISPSDGLTKLKDTGSFSPTQGNWYEIVLQKDGNTYKAWLLDSNGNLVQGGITASDSTYSPDTYGFESFDSGIIMDKLTEDIPNSSPSIDSVDTDPDSWTLNSDINVSANVSDSDGNITEVLFEVFNETGSEIANKTKTFSSSTVNTTAVDLFSPTSPQNYTVNITATDNDGAQSVNTIEQKATDATAPSISFNPSTTNGAQTISRDWVFVNVTATDNYNLTSVTEEFEGTNSSFVTNQGNHYWTNHTGLTDGTYTFQAFAEDGSSNNNSTAQRKVTLDTTAPSLTIDSPQNQSYSTDSVDLNVSANETVDTWQYELDNNGTNVTFSPNTSLTNLSDGSHTIKVFANDSSGNTGSASIQFTTDTSPPEVFNFQDNITDKIVPKQIKIWAEFRDNTTGLNKVKLASNESGTFENESLLLDPAFNFSNQEITLNDGNPQDAYLNNSIWYSIGRSDDKVREYFQANGSLKTSHDVSSESSEFRSIYLGNDGNWYLLSQSDSKVYEYFGNNFSFTGNSFSVSESTDPKGLYQDDSSNWYVLGNGEFVHEYDSSFNLVNEFNLSSALGDLPEDLGKTVRGNWWFADDQSLNQVVRINNLSNGVVSKTVDVSSESDSAQGLFFDEDRDYYLISATSPDEILEYDSERRYSNITGRKANNTFTFKNGSARGFIGFEIWAKDGIGNWKKTGRTTVQVNELPVFESVRAVWKINQSKDFWFNYSDPDTNDIKNVSSPLRGVVDTESNTSATLQSFGDSVFWDAKATDFLGESSNPHTVDFNSSTNKKAWTDDQSGVNNDEDSQNVQFEADLIINGDGIKYNVTRSGFTPDFTQQVVNEFNDETNTLTTLDAAASWDFVVDHINTTNQSLQENTSASNNLSNQSLVQNKTLDNIRAYPLGRSGDDRIEVSAFDMPGTCIDCGSRFTKFNSNEAKNFTYNSSGDFLDNQTNFDFSPQSFEVVLNTSYIGDRKYQLNNTVNASFNNINITANVSKPSGCSQTNNTLVNVSADQATNYTVEMSCDTGDVAADLTQIKDSDSENDTQYWYNSTSLNITTNETKDSQIVWKIQESDLNDWDARKGNVKIGCSGNIVSSNVSFTDPSNNVRVNYGPNSPCGSSLTTSSSSIEFGYEVASGDTTDVTGGGGGGGGVSPTTDQETIVFGGLSTEKGIETFNIDFGSETVRNLTITNNGENDATVTIEEDTGPICRFVSVQRTLDSDLFGGQGTYNVPAASVDSLGTVQPSSVEIQLRFNLPNRTVLESRGISDFSCGFDTSSSFGTAESLKVRASERFFLLRLLFEKEFCLEIPLASGNVTDTGVDKVREVCFKLWQPLTVLLAVVFVFFAVVRRRNEGR